MRIERTDKPAAARRALLILHPADIGVLALLVVACLVAILGRGSAEQRRLLVVHVVLLAGYGGFTVAATVMSRRTWVSIVRPFAAMGVIFTLYATMSRLGMVAIPWRSDPVLSRVDQWLFGGTNPSFFIQRWQTRGRVEFFAFFYALFIPYVNFSLLVGSLGRPPLERDQFLIGWVFVYCISLAGCLLLPGVGPGGYFAAAYAVPLTGGFFYHLTLIGVAQTGGLMGIFPSLHVGSSAYLCLFDLRTHRLRGLTYLPAVLMIYGATIFLRYHYVTDVLAGTVVAVGCNFLGSWACLKWARARQRAGLPALPGGEQDALPGVPIAGGDRAAAVLSAN
ncbi:MAG TPA: phosphatase PAP2 family protein [Tepidisphaeraceae bacterium]|jgi:hypothetical protein|nr:phosphatase PAP2 family protein [Tepidisphaeraceae bacterium]